MAVSAEEPARILGYYTLSPASLEYACTPAVIRKNLARYDVPVFRLGRLAVALALQGRGLGGALLFRAAERCLLVAQEVGGVGVLIDGKHDRAADWYASLGAVPLPEAKLSLLMPFATVAEALGRVTER